MNNTKGKKGFTLIEIIAAIALGIFVMGFIISTVYSELHYLRTAKNNEILHSDAIFIFDNLNYLIKRAQGATTSGPTLEITLLDSSAAIIATNTDNYITINGIPFNSANTKVTSLNFLKIGKSIRVGLTLKIKNAESYFSATTTIAQRPI